MKKIWCLFSVRNDYGQPLNNLVCAWLEKPELPEFSKTFGLPNDLDKQNIYDVVNKYGEMLSLITAVYKGEERRIDYCDYRFEEIEAGKLLKQ